MFYVKFFPMPGRYIEGERPKVTGKIFNMTILLGN